MASVVDVVAYLLREYPHPDELSNARVTKMVYLADWKHAIEHSQQLTPIRWFFHDYGPFVWDVKHEVESRPDLFSVVDTENLYGSRKLKLELRTAAYAPRLTAEEATSIQHVIDETKQLNYREFIALVYSTFPIVASDRYKHLDLVKLAAEYTAIPF